MNLLSGAFLGLFGEPEADQLDVTFFCGPEDVLVLAFHPLIGSRTPPGAGPGFTLR